METVKKADAIPKLQARGCIVEDGEREIFITWPGEKHSRFGVYLNADSTLHLDAWERSVDHRRLMRVLDLHYPQFAGSGQE